MGKVDIQYEPWTVVRVLGSGSYGTVYEIKREEFGETYRAALKVISIPESEDDILKNRAEGMSDQSMNTYYQSVVQELTQEFAILSKLKGTTNIVGYEDHKVVQHKDGIGWDIYVRMELLTPLTQISAYSTLTRDAVIKLGIDICTALILCNSKNIIHRDIKPDNIFVSENGDFELGDFGIARTASKTMSNMSRKGTPNYMAPEVYLNQAYNANVDVYSLGIVMYQLMNGKRLPFIPEEFTISDKEAAISKRIGGVPLPTPEFADPELARVILKACAYNPADRYASAEEMKRDLVALLHGQEVKYAVDPSVVNATVSEAKYGQEDPNATYGFPGGKQSAGAERLRESSDKTVALGAGKVPGQAGAAVSRYPDGQGGAAVSRYPKNSAPTRKQKKGISKEAIIIGIASVVIVALIGVVIVLLNRDGGDDGDEDTQEVMKETQEDVSVPASDPADELMPDVASAPTTEAAPGATSAPTTEAAPGATSAPAQKPAEIIGALSDNPADYVFELEGVIYKLPARYQDFVDHGWTLYDSGSASSLKETDEMSARNYQTSYLTNGMVKVSVDILNPSVNALMVKDCYVAGIEIPADKNLKLTLAKGVSLLSSVDEIKEAYGLPSSSKTYDDYEYMTYSYSEANIFEYLKFSVYQDTTHNSISMRNFVAEQVDVSKVSTTTPVYLATYKAPAALGNSATDVIFELDQKLYRMPCPLSEFTEAGWEITRLDEQCICGWNRATAAVTIKKGDVKATLDMFNYSRNIELTQNCAVTSISLESKLTSYSDTRIPGSFLKLSGGITLELTADKLKTIVGDLFVERTSDTSRTFTYATNDSARTVKYYYYEQDNYSSTEVTLKNMDWDY